MPHIRASSGSTETSGRRTEAFCRNVVVEGTELRRGAGRRLRVRVLRATWHWRAAGKLDRQSFRSLMADDFQWENKGEWWRWNLRSRLGYAISPEMQAVFTFEFSGIEAGASGSESDLLGGWRGGNIALGIQWRQSSRSKWMPRAEDFNGLFMK